MLPTKRGIVNDLPDGARYTGNRKEDDPATLERRAVHERPQGNHARTVRILRLFHPIAEGKYYIVDPFDVGLRKETKRIPLMIGARMAEFLSPVDDPRAFFKFPAIRAGETRDIQTIGVAQHDRISVLREKLA